MGEFHLSSYKKVLSPSRCEGVSSCVANREVPDKLQVLAERVPRCQERSVSIQRILLTFRRDCEGCPIVLKASESIWRYPVFAFICCVSIHLEISATVVRSAPEELPNLCSFRKASAARSPMMMQGAMVLPVVTRGMIEPSAMRRFSIP
jgi:hypothetical protein